MEWLGVLGFFIGTGVVVGFSWGFIEGIFSSLKEKKIL